MATVSRKNTIRGSFDGQWVAGKAHGFGKCTHQDGSSYSGEWVQDEKSGLGMERFVHGTRYEGAFLRGCKHGKGCFMSSSDRLSQFIADQMHGKGTHGFANEGTYIGEWTEGQMM